MFTQIINSGADGIIAIANTVEAALIMRATFNMGIDLPLLGASVFSVGESINNAGHDAAEGWYTVTDWAEALDTPESLRFMEGWNAMFPGVPPIQNNVFAYDALFILADAIERAGSADPAAINKALGEVYRFAGALTVYTVDENRTMGTTQVLTRTNAYGLSEVIDVITFR